jgi:hypothetical protein
VQLLCEELAPYRDAHAPRGQPDGSLH